MLFVQNSFLDKIRSLKSTFLFALILIGYYGINWLNHNYILTRDVFHQLFLEQIDTNRIDVYFEYLRKWNAVGLFLLPFLLWTKFLIVTALIQFIFLFSFIEIPFQCIFRIVLKASFVQLIAEVFRSFKLIAQPSRQITMTDMNYVPFSISNFLPADNFPQPITLLIMHFNLFEFIWLYTLYHGLLKINLNAKLALKSVLQLWLIMLMFQLFVVLFLQAINSE